MTTVICCNSNNKNKATVDSHFARCNYFMIIKSGTTSGSFIKNKAAGEKEGAAAKAFEIIRQYNPAKIISGDFGTKAIEILKKHNCQMVIFTDTTKTISEIVTLINTR